MSSDIIHKEIDFFVYSAIEKERLDQKFRERKISLKF